MYPLRYLSEIGSVYDFSEVLQSLNHISTRKKNPININNVTGNLPNKPIPNGCKEYFFKDGYYCIASSEKVAIKKHNKFLKQM